MRNVEAQHAVPATAGKRDEGDGNGAAERCREFEGVPQFSLLVFPQEWGTKGVDEGDKTDLEALLDSRSLLSQGQASRE